MVKATTRLLLGIVGLLQQRDEEHDRVRREAQMILKYGRCEHCGEILFQPIHATDCPARSEEE